MEEQTVIRSAAKPGAGKPAGAASSVFDIATPPQARPRRALVTIDPEAVKIERNVAIPLPRNGNESPWQQVYARMKKGDMVRLTSKQATSFMSWGKKAKGDLTRRSLGPDSAGVWRTA